jgi:hypothetical protein
MRLMLSLAVALTLALAPARLSIVFIFADDWGWGDLSCHGNTLLATSHLDRPLPKCRWPTWFHAVVHDFPNTPQSVAAGIWMGGCHRAFRTIGARPGSIRPVGFRRSAPPNACC